ncbi:MULTISPECIES: DnaA N-terminal domain-containing protein [unclassified Mameliella]|uniref:DnaA N-terminal domain-containing protein n=1 Tax=unclassified Mameliella TaxID=2630630 RepID=UPI00273F18E2|nr:MULTISPECIES: DnaA N-terminal domain-containing protein [unclassified Mameliella]
MQAIKPVGRGAPAMKYDILSALGVLALSLDKHRQKLILRLMVLITTRYNWQSGELSIGRAEIARLWSVDERTVKRELAKLRSLGWLEVKRAGVKGRVTVYSIDLAALLGETREVWEVIGPDVAARLGAPEPAPADDKVVPFQPRAAATGGQGGTWDKALAALEAGDPAQTRAWFAGLVEADCTGGRLTLLAPSRFIADYVGNHHAARLLAVVSGIDPSVREVRVEAQ